MNGPNCRFILDGLKVDVMPSEGTVLGFTNRWYDFALASANVYLMPDGTSIKLISTPAFVATKLEAFHDRGQENFALSHDMEDIVAVVNGRSELLDEIQATDVEIRKYISESFSKLVGNREFIDSVGMHLLPDEGSQTRTRIIIDRIRAIANL